MTAPTIDTAAQLKLQRKIIAKVYSRVAAVVFGLCDEGDRIYFGSSNDADILRDLKDEWDAHRIMGEPILSSEQEVAALKKRVAKLKAQAAAWKADAERLAGIAELLVPRGYVDAALRADALAAHDAMMKENGNG